jgi:hypothetical protein
VGPIGTPSRSSDVGKEHEPAAFDDLGYRGNLGALLVIGPHLGAPIGHMPWPAGHLHRWHDGSSGDLLCNIKGLL